MRVYVKKNEYDPMYKGFIVMTVFLVVVILVFFFIFTSDDIVATLINRGIDFIFAFIFLLFDIYFIFYALKPAKGFNAKLISKEKQIYKNKDICYMVFEVVIDEFSRTNNTFRSTYTCFTYGDNELCVDCEYTIYVKEFNWKIRRVSDKKSNKIFKIPTPSVLIVYFAIAFILACNDFFCILGLCYYPEYFTIYIILGVLFSFGLVFIIKLIRDEISRNKNYYNDNDKI